MQVEYTLEELQAARVGLNFRCIQVQADVDSLEKSLRHATDHLAWLKAEHSAVDRAIAKAKEQED